MNRTHIAALLLSCFCSTLASGADWSMQPLQIHTRWDAQVSPSNALPEYPRPQLVREHWTNLSGLWQYAITEQGASVPASYEGQILVPYPIESALSGVQKSLQPSQWLWYQRTITKASGGEGGGRTLLHFGAVDWQATVYVNGKEVGSHTGGYQNFTLDITDALKDGSNELVVKVYDPTDQGPNPHGKQVLHPEGIMYTPTSGIWQTVWLETVPRGYIDHLELTPDVDAGQLKIKAVLGGDAGGYTVQAVALSGKKRIAAQTFQGTTVLAIPKAHLWSPDDPFLYDLQVRLLKDGKPVDEVKSYFGMRKIEVKKDDKGVERIFLNNRYTYNLGTLDQGFWPDGLYTAPTDEALKFDIQAIKAMGFNTIRKHIKVEPDRWYYHCDTLGMLVWQDMVNPGNDTPEGREEFEREARDTVAQLHNHPSITTWVLFNEGWGAYDQARLTTWMKELDPSRLVNGHTGENYFGDSPKEPEKKWPNSDLVDVHNYPPPALPPHLAGKASVLGEFGGIGVFIDQHVWNDLSASGWGYVKVTPEQLAAKYEEMADQAKGFEVQGLSGSIYTQPFDVEGEQNGLMTYDRAVVKVPLETMRRINGKLIPTTANTPAATAGIQIENADLTPEAQRYAALLVQYQNGNREPGFLRHLTLMAIRQKDQVHATEVGNAYIDQFAKPYTADSWRFIAGMTRTPQDRGFEAFETQSSRADALLGEGASKRLIQGVAIQYELESKLVKDDLPIFANPNWDSFKATIAARYPGVDAQRIVADYALNYYKTRDPNRERWAVYKDFLVKHYPPTPGMGTALELNNGTWEAFLHSTDPHVLEMSLAWVDLAIRQDATLPKNESGLLGYLDTKANVLYKLGRVDEAIKLEQQAVDLDAGNSPEITANLAKMKRGEQTWLPVPAGF